MKDNIKDKIITAGVVSSPFVVTGLKKVLGAKAKIVETQASNTVKKGLNSSVDITLNWNTNGSTYNGSHQFVVGGAFIHEDDYRGPSDYDASEVRQLPPKHGTDEDLEAGESTTTNWSIKEVRKGTCNTKNPEVNLFNKLGYYHMGCRVYETYDTNTDCPYNEKLYNRKATTGIIKNAVKVVSRYAAQPREVIVDGTSIWVK